MRALVTGGSGFVGAALVKALLSRGWDVWITTRYGNVSKNPRLADVWDQIHVHEADVRNRGALAEVINLAKLWDVVFHLAAYHHVGHSWQQTEECAAVNVMGTVNVADLTMKTGARLIYMSSSEVYGNPGDPPWTEDMKPNPQSPYAVTKYAGELYCQIHQERGANIQIVRPFNIYGPGQSTRAVIPMFIEKIKKDGEVTVAGNGSQTRDFNYVDDVVEGLIMAAGGPVVEGPVNLATGIETAIVNIPKYLGVLLSKSGVIHEGELRPNEIMRMAGLAKRAYRVWGWKPRMHFYDGLAKTVKSMGDK